MLGTKIQGAKIVDGTGAPAETGDLGIRDGKIVARGRVDEPAREVVDADGALATRAGWTSTPTTTGRSPGTTSWTPSASHGVTTVVMATAASALPLCTPAASRS